MRSRTLTITIRVPFGWYAATKWVALENPFSIKFDLELVAERGWEGAINDLHFNGVYSLPEATRHLLMLWNTRLRVQQRHAERDQRLREIEERRRRPRHSQPW